MRDFRNLNIWKKGFQIAINGFKITKTFPPQEKFGLTIQITKAGVSIPSNIAEGCGRSSDKGFKRFLDHALGSAFEMETQLLISKTLAYGDLALTTITLGLLSEEERMINSFMSTLKISE